MSDDAFGDMNADPDVEMRRRLPEKLRELFVCDYDPTSLDHGHTLCYFVEMAAREIEDLRADRARMEAQWRVDPRRAVHCDDLECVCAGCPVKGCPCNELR